MQKWSRLKGSLACLVFRAARVLLIFALVVQVLVLYLHVAGRSVSLPTDWLAEKLERRIGGGVQVKIGQAAWRAPMTIELTDVALGIDVYSEPVVRLRTLVGQWTAGALWWGEVTPDSLLVEGLEAVIPAVHSGTGTGEVAIDDFVVGLMREGRVWNIERADGYVVGVPVQLRGRIRPDTIRLLASARRKHLAAAVDRPDETAAERLGAFFSKVIDVREQLKQIGKPYLELIVGSEARSVMTVECLFSGRSLAVADEFSAGRVFGSGAFALGVSRGTDSRLTFSLAVAAQTESARWKDQLELGLLAAAVHFESIGPMRNGLPGVGLWVHNVRLPDQSLDAAWAHLSIDDWPAVSGRVVVQDHFGFADASGRVDVVQGNGDLDFNAWLNLEHITADSGFVPDRLKDRLSFTKPLSLTGKVHFSDGWELSGSEFEGYCMDLQVYDIRATTLAGAGAYDPVTRRLELRDLFLENDEYTVRGEYIEDFDRNRYRFLLEGSVVPTDLNSLLGEDWWDELFSYFEFSPGHLPSADLDIGGSWDRSTDRWRMYFGSIGVKDFSFRGIDYQAVDLMLYVTQQTVTLFDLDLRQGDKAARAMIQWVDDEQGRDEWLAFSGSSDLPLQPLAITIGKEVEEVVRDFETSGSVSVNVAGRIWDSRLRPQNPEDIFLRVDFADAVSWQGYAFERMAGNVRLLDGVVNLSSMQFGIAGGEGEGTLVLDKDGDGADQFHLDVRVTGADHMELVESIPFTRGVDLAEDEEGDPDRKRSDLSLEIDIAGPVDDVDRITGHGTIRLRKAELGRIHILGGLSRVLDWNIIHFGSFNLTDVDGLFSLADGKVNFPQLEIKGPTVRLEAQGDFTIEGQDLDFYLYVHPVGGIRGPIMRTLTWAFDPVSRSFKVTVKGTWDDPEYTVGFNPLNAF